MNARHKRAVNLAAYALFCLDTLWRYHIRSEDQKIEHITYRPSWCGYPTMLCFYLTEEVEQLGLEAVQKLYLDAGGVGIEGKNHVGEFGKDTRHYRTFEQFREEFWALNGDFDSSAYWLWPDREPRIVPRHPEHEGLPPVIRHSISIDEEKYNKPIFLDMEALVAQRAARILAAREPERFPNIEVEVDTACMFHCTNLKAGSYQSVFVDRTIGYEDHELETERGGVLEEGWRDAQVAALEQENARYGGNEARQVANAKEGQALWRRGINPDRVIENKFDRRIAGMWRDMPDPEWPAKPPGQERTAALVRPEGRFR